MNLSRFHIVTFSESGQRHGSTDHAACIAPRQKKPLNHRLLLDTGALNVM